MQADAGAPTQDERDVVAEDVQMLLAGRWQAGGHAMTASAPSGARSDHQGLRGVPARDR